MADAGDSAANNTATDAAPVSASSENASAGTDSATPNPEKAVKMSFADWKKCKEALDKPPLAKGDAIPRNGQRNKPQHQKFHSPNKQQHGDKPPSGPMNQKRNAGSAPLNRPPPMPLPLMSLSFGNFGPPPMPPPQCNMDMGPSRCHRPLQPPPFWEDMMSPQHRPPPIQPPMPKCPSLWNLVPKDKGPNRSQQQQNRRPQQFNNNNKNNNGKGRKDASMMPPPPPPPDRTAASDSTSNSSKQNGSQPPKKIKRNGGTFVQIDGQWIQKPEAPPPLDECAPGTKEERQRQWKEYRQAMKPFKNREFLNWKRSVQRLSKIPRDQLDEKQLERLEKAEEYIGAHKAMLTIKHAERWVQQENKTANTASATDNSGQGQVFVRKPISTFWDKKKTGNNINQFKPGAPQGKKYFGTGRAIKGAGIDTSVAPPLPTPIGQYPQQHMQQAIQPPATSNYFGQGYSSSTYGEQPSTSNSYYAGYIKADPLLPP